MLFRSEGIVDLFAADADGREVRIAELSAGDFHGEAAIAAGQVSESRAVARTDVVEVEVDARAMAGWLTGSSGLATEIGDAIAQRRRVAQRLRRRHDGSDGQT